MANTDGLRVGQPTKAGTFVLDLKLQNGSGIMRTIEVPISSGWTPTEKRDEILKWVNDYSLNGNKPFQAMPDGVSGILLRDSAGNRLGYINARDYTGQAGMQVVYSAASPSDVGTVSLEGLPTGPDGQGAPGVARAGLDGVFVAQVNTQGLSCGCVVLDELRQLLVQNGVPAVFDAAGNLGVPLGLAGATSLEFGTSDAGLRSEGRLP